MAAPRAAAAAAALCGAAAAAAPDACPCPWTAPCMRGDACEGRIEDGKKDTWTVCRSGAVDCHTACPAPSYFELDAAWMFLPALLLLLVPASDLGFPFGWPRGTPWEYIRIGFFQPLICSFFAIIFSTVWDNIIAGGGVWTFNARCMVGVFLNIPYEEYAWFVLHTCLGQLVLLRLWGMGPRRHGLRPRPAFVEPRWRDPAIVAGALCGAAGMLAGVYALYRTWGPAKDHGLLYIGIVCSFVPPILGGQWYYRGHMFLWQPLQWGAAILIESVYTVVLDQWAISKGIWHIYPASGLHLPVSLFGNPPIQLEQVLIYSLTTVLVVNNLFPHLVAAEAYMASGAADPFKTWTKAFLKADGVPPDHAKEPAPMPRTAPSADALA